VPQTLAGAVDTTTLEGAKQTISISPLASQEFIKELGANGGGFNANSAHPFENPNAWTNLARDICAHAYPDGLGMTSPNISPSCRRCS
jgi:K+-transporting ATPase ATPase A chain